jgi:ABC-type nickel/cobalt efflux system permease component RcnA
MNYHPIQRVCAHTTTKALIKGIPILLIILLLSSSFVTASPFKATALSEQPQELSFTQSILKKINTVQLDIRQEVTTAAKHLRENKEVKALFLLAGLSFLYGLVHALGPGHGKSIIMSCMLAEKTPTIVRGIITGAIIAFGEMLAAIIVIVTVFHFTIGKLSHFFETNSGPSKLAYIIIFLIGCLLLISRIKKHLPLLRSNHKTAIKPSTTTRSYPVALLLGIIPCPGVLILLSFMFSMQMPWIGVLLAIFMAVGMALTISCFGILVIFCKKRSLSCFNNNQQRLQRIEAGLEIIGATLITVIGFSLSFVH